MPNKMERFTLRARRVLTFSQEEAERLQHDRIGTEHLLLGLYREESGVAGKVLRDMGLQLQPIEALVQQLSEAQPRTVTQLDLAPVTKKVLESAVDEARKLGHHYIGTEHLLLGLVRHEREVACKVLERLGVRPHEVRKQTRRVLLESLEESPEAESQMHSHTFVMERERQKVLQMVDEGKITAEQGVELLKALAVTAVPIPPETSGVIYSMLMPRAAMQSPMELAKRQLHFLITDKETGTVKFDFQVPYSEVSAVLRTLTFAFYAGQATTLLSRDVGDDHIEASIE